MAGLQMPRRGDGAAMLRELRDEERPLLETAPSTTQEQLINGQVPVLTEARTYGSTGGREYASAEFSTEGSADALTGAGTEGRKPARKAGRAEGSKEARPQASKQGRAHAAEDDPPDILEVVEAALASREPLIGGVKATVDMSPELSTRAKRYLADHRGQNTRQVIVALLDAFLSARGY